MNKEYIGDGVYAEIEHGMLKLSTERLEGTHAIYLEKNVYDNLVDYVKRLEQQPINE